MIANLTFDPDQVTITAHAYQRYTQRRDTNPAATHRGIMRLLTLASNKPLPPVKILKGLTSRQFQVAGFTLVMTTDLATLITVAPDPRRTKRKPRTDASGHHW